MTTREMMAMTMDNDNGGDEGDDNEDDFDDDGDNDGDDGLSSHAASTTFLLRTAVKMVGVLATPGTALPASAPYLAFKDVRSPCSSKGERKKRKGGRWGQTRRKEGGKKGTTVTKTIPAAAALTTPRSCR